MPTPPRRARHVRSILGLASPLRRLRAPAMLAATGALLFAAGPLAAQVIEIGEDGTVTRHDGAGLYLATDAGGAPIRSVPAPAPVVAPAALPAQALSAPATIEALIAASSAAHGISAALTRAVAWHESRFRPNVVSSKGAIGVMQLMPATARSLGVNPFDAAANIEGGVTFLASLLRRYDGDLVRTLAAYSAGPGAVARFGGVPPFRETRDYVASIMGTLAGRGSPR